MNALLKALSMASMRAWILSVLFTLVTLSFAAESKKDTAEFRVPTDIPLVEQMKMLKDTIAPKARLGVSVYSLKQNKFLYQINDKELFKPASTLKLVVTAAALDTFPLDYYPSTGLLLEGRISGVGDVKLPDFTSFQGPGLASPYPQHVKGGRFSGDIVIQGGGDPNISARYFPDPLMPFRFWADSLKAIGIDTLSGKIILDTSYIKGPRRPATWEKRFFDRWYGAEISSLTFNDNCVLMKVGIPDSLDDTVVVEFQPDLGIYQVDSFDVKVVQRPRYRRGVAYAMDPDQNRIRITGEMGVDARPYYSSIPVRNPPEFFLRAFMAAMDSSGIVVDTNVRNYKKQPYTFQRQFRFTTAPFLSMLDEINQRSQNLHAEILLRMLGDRYYGEGSLEKGIQAEKQFLYSLGLDSSSFTLEDGSGLSYGNRIVPRNMTLLLQSMARHPKGHWYFQSLGAPGISGAKATRLSHLETSHRVRMKTGFINHVQGLAGYILGSDGDTLCTSLFLNGYRINTQEARDLMDTIWHRITNHHNMEFASLREAAELWHQVRAQTDSYEQRVDWLSRYLLGRPYELGPTGEGWSGKIEAKPLCKFESFDCVTYMEHVLAVARASHPDSILPELNRIRYVDGKVEYSSRKHYFVEDWIRHSPDLVQQKVFAGDTAGTRVMDKKKFYGSKKIPWKKENPKTQLTYTPWEKAVEYATEKNWNKNYIIGFVGKYPNIWVTHTGFVIPGPNGEARLRHASLRGNKVREDSLKEYLESRKGSVVGVVFLELKDQK